MYIPYILYIINYKFISSFNDDLFIKTYNGMKYKCAIIVILKNVLNDFA